MALLKYLLRVMFFVSANLSMVSGLLSMMIHQPGLIPAARGMPAAAYITGQAGGLLS